MDLRQVPRQVAESAAQAPPFVPARTGRRRPAPPLALGRRRFVGLAAGVAAVGTALGPSLWSPRPASAHGDHTPRPIPGGSAAIAQLAGRTFHVFGPDPRPMGIDPPDAEPSTITDFAGMVGLGYISGMCRRTNTATGEVRELPFTDSDLRFMTGSFLAMDGQVHRGAFAFI